MTLRNTSLMMLLMACGFLVVGQLYITIPLVNDIMARFGVTSASAVLSGSAFGFAYAAGFLVFGPLSDKYGRRRIILIGLVATALSTVLVAMSQNFAMLLAARAIQGLTASTFPPAALSLVAEELPPQNRPFGVSLMSIAFLGAAPLAQFFAAQAGGGLPMIMLELSPLYVIGAVGLFFAAKRDSATASVSSAREGSRLEQFQEKCVAVFRPELRKNKDLERRFESIKTRNALIPLLRNAAVVAAWAAAVTVLFGFVSFHASLLALGTSLGLDLQTVRLIGLPPLVLAFAAAPMTRRYGPSVTACMGLLITALALIIALAGSAVSITIASAILAGGVALAVPGLIAIVAGCATHSNRGLALAIYSFCLFLGASFAPPITQALVGFGALPLRLLSAGMLVAAALFVIVPKRSP